MLRTDIHPVLLRCSLRLRRDQITRLVAVAFMLAGLLLKSVSHATDARTPVIAAASSLQFALPEIAESFTQSTGHKLKLVFGSSGNLTRQIRQGAPFELYMAADEHYVETLVEAGLTRDSGHVYANGRLVLAIPPGSILKPDATLNNLGESVAAGQLQRFAIANPEHAPYGERARQALQHMGLWDAIQEKLLFGENVVQAAQFALSANAQGGIIAHSLALAPTLSGKASYTLIPADYHLPLRQRMVLLKTSGKIAELFYQFMQQTDAIAVLKSYGFAQSEF